MTGHGGCNRLTRLLSSLNNVFLEIADNLAKDLAIGPVSEFHWNGVDDDRTTAKFADGESNSLEERLSLSVDLHFDCGQVDVERDQKLL